MFELNILTEEEFKNKCNHFKYCHISKNRTKNCMKEYKQIKCYKKYVERMKKEQKAINDGDQKWIDVCEIVDKRDNHKCQLWEILSNEQKQFIKEVYGDEFSFFSKTLDHAHIIPRSKDKSKIYDLDNIVLISRYFHRLLDDNLHPVTRDFINDIERLNWMNKARFTNKKN